MANARRPVRHPGANAAPNAAPHVKLVSIADLPTRFGHFRAVAFTPDAQGKEHIAIVRGTVRGARGVPVRVHSECLTGDVIGSLRCDCRDQLQHALEQLGSLSCGVLLYLRQEGRGIGLTNKIRAYALQDDGHDTVEANHLLGFGDDERDYAVAADMLRALGLHSIRLMTNNPRKVTGLREHGITVAGRIPIIVEPNRHNASYLRTKQQRSGHWLGVSPARGGYRGRRSRYRHHRLIESLPGADRTRTMSCAMRCAIGARGGGQLACAQASICSVRSVACGASG